MGIDKKGSTVEEMVSAYNTIAAKLGKAHITYGELMRALPVLLNTIYSDAPLDDFMQLITNQALAAAQVRALIDRGILHDLKPDDTGDNNLTV